MPGTQAARVQPAVLPSFPHTQVLHSCLKLLPGEQENPGVLGAAVSRLSLPPMHAFNVHAAVLPSLLQVHQLQSSLNR